MGNVHLALGLIGIGKPWGHVPAEVPSESEALEFLEYAWKLGIRHFDTAASYGAAGEERLGKFVRELAPRERAQAVVATKFGEHWDDRGNQPYVDHSYDALRRSLDRSVARLGVPDILQLHKTNPEVLRSDDLSRAWEYAAAAGVREFGASVSDPESARIAAAAARYAWLQLPYNAANPRSAAWIDAAARAGKRVAVNRPFAMGAMLHGPGRTTGADAFAFVLRKQFDGVILTGTRSREHLAENFAAFKQAQAG